ATIETTKLDWSTGSVLLSRGDTFPDSLRGGALAGIDEQPILLTDDPSDLGTPAANYLQANSGAIIGVAALGGTSALTDDVWHQALNDADDQSASVRTYTMER
ncbi:MAG TPA: cell wall-binding repeat-containing protein, partial [Acidimicrobiales bacterium]|nr:cell wall-binding repeat-containing protein [Acidimicrobiales bacterium]